MAIWGQMADFAMPGGSKIDTSMTDSPHGKGSHNKNPPSDFLP